MYLCIPICTFEEIVDHVCFQCTAWSLLRRRFSRWPDASSSCMTSFQSCHRKSVDAQGAIAKFRETLDQKITSDSALQRSCLPEHPASRTAPRWTGPKGNSQRNRTAAMSKPFYQQASIITWDLDMALLLWIFWSDHIFGWSFTVHMHLLMVNLCKSPFVLACTRLFVAILCWFNGKASQYAMFGV